MFARFTRIPLHRSIHTQAARPHSLRYARAALGTSAVAVAYLTWRSLSDPIALDSAVPTQCMFFSLVSTKSQVHFAHYRVDTISSSETCCIL